MSLGCTTYMEGPGAGTELMGSEYCVAVSGDAEDPCTFMEVPGKIIKEYIVIIARLLLSGGSAVLELCWKNTILEIRIVSVFHEFRNPPSNSGANCL